MGLLVLCSFTSHKTHGNWCSDTYQKYLEFDLEDRAKVARSMVVSDF